MCRLVGISACARMASEGGNYCLVCIQLLSKCGVPGYLRVSKVDLKVGLKWLSMQDIL